MPTEAIPRLDDDTIRKKILPLCRLKPGKIWEDPTGRHRIGVLDAVSKDDCERISGNESVDLCFQISMQVLAIIISPVCFRYWIRAFPNNLSELHRIGVSLCIDEQYL